MATTRTTRTKKPLLIRITREHNPQRARAQKREDARQRFMSKVTRFGELMWQSLRLEDAIKDAIRDGAIDERFASEASRGCGARGPRA